MSERAQERSGSGTTPKLDTATLWERTYEHLREEILANRLPPGTELSEVPLSQELGVSRGPVREAIGRLAAEGLVTVRPRRGAVVSTLDAGEFLAAYQVREALETLAIRLAVPRLDAAGLERLQALVDEMVGHAERGDVTAFFRANAAFHATFVEASGNPLLQEMMRGLLGRMGRYRMRSVELRGSLERSTAEHRAILRAVRAGDAERAARLLGEHIRIPQRRLEAAPDEEVVLTHAR